MTTSWSIASNNSTIMFHLQSKLLAKTGPAKFQWQIMQSLDIPEEEIPLFAHTDHWLEYFPPLAKKDLHMMGLKVGATHK